jgi:hypothetical protein
VPATAALIVLIVTFLFAAHAHAVVYWQTLGHYNGNALNRANLDKQPPESVQAPFTELPPGDTTPDLTAHGGFIYSLDHNKPAIGRMRADGTQIEPSFIPIDFASRNVAVNSSGIYWTRADFGQSTIARADLDGSDVNTSFITLPPKYESVGGIAASQTALYWSADDSEFGGQVIGRANTDGSGVNLAFVSPPNVPESLAASDAHVYWVSQETGIGRARSDGSEADPFFAPTSVIGAEPFGAFDLAVAGPYLFWGNYNFDTVGRMNLDGSGVNPNFINYSEDGDGLIAIAADPLIRPIAVITKAPKEKTAKRKAKISFKSPNAPDASFRCKLDNKNYKPCSSPVKVKAKPGKHKFLVQAVNATGPSPYPARAKWKVERKG